MKKCLWLLLAVWGMSFLFALPVRAADVSVDTDGDGIPDVQEINVFHTDPLKADTDGDGYDDRTEILNGYNPNGPGQFAFSKSIFINVSKQVLEQRVDNVPLASFPVSTGVTNHPSPEGNFKIIAKTPRAWSRVGHLWMPWWMNFSGDGAPSGRFGIHELPVWPDGRKEGEDHLGKPASHGCVRLGIGPAKTLYDWTPVGTQVVISR